MPASCGPQLFNNLDNLAYTEFTMLTLSLGRESVNKGGAYYAVLPCSQVSVPTRVQEFVNAPDLKEHKHFAVILVVGQTLVLWDPKVPAALDGYVQCRGHVSLILKWSVTHISEIKLIRTDTTLDLSQKAEKVCFKVQELYELFPARAKCFCGLNFVSGRKFLI